MTDNKQTQDGQQKEVLSAESGYDWVSVMITALLCVAVVFTLFFRMVSVKGDSMKNTLHNGDRLIMISQFYTIERGDVVVINRDNDDPLIKRVIAVAGDTIKIDDTTGKVMLNGAYIDEPYVNGGVTPSFGFDDTYTVPDGFVFAMGDNRPDSKDSRMLGAFSLDDVLGKTVFRLWPDPGAVRNGE